MNQIPIGFLTLALCVAAGMGSAQNAQIAAAETGMTCVTARLFVPVGPFESAPDKVAADEPLAVIICRHDAVGNVPEREVP